MWLAEPCPVPPKSVTADRRPRGLPRSTLEPFGGDTRPLIGFTSLARLRPRPATKEAGGSRPGGQNGSRPQWSWTGHQLERCASAAVTSGRPQLATCSRASTADEPPASPPPDLRAHLSRRDPRPGPLDLCTVTAMTGRRLGGVAILATCGHHLRRQLSLPWSLPRLIRQTRPSVP